MAFDKTKFLAPEMPATETVTVPGFGPVTVRGLTATEYTEYETASQTHGKGPDGKPTFAHDRPLVARLAVIDPETGLQAFGDADLPALRQLPATVVLPIARAVFRLCGVLKADDSGN